MVVTKPRIIKEKQVQTLEQKIVHVYNKFVKVMSRNGNVYTVNLSDAVKKHMNPEPGDTAIVKTFPDEWLVTDIHKKEKPPVLSEEEEKRETERQIKEIMDIWGGY